MVRALEGEATGEEIGALQGNERNERERAGETSSEREMRGRCGLARGTSETGERGVAAGRGRRERSGARLGFGAVWAGWA